MITTRSKTRAKAKAKGKARDDENEEISQLRSQLENEKAISASYRQMVDQQKKGIVEQQRQIIQKQKLTIQSTKLELESAREDVRRLSVLHQSSSPFLKKLPVEIRIKIYKLLLVNPELGESSSIGTNVNFGRSKKFELTPAILRVCRTITNEADPILYGSNTFIMECIGAYGPSGCHTPQSPLTRYILNDQPPGEEYNFEFHLFKPLKKVRHWKILTAAYRPVSAKPVPAKLFVHFCQTMCTLPSEPVPPTGSYNVIVALTKESLVHKGVDQHELSRKQLECLMKPLQLLRNGDLDLRIAKQNEMPAPSDELCLRPNYYFPDTEDNMKYPEYQGMANEVFEEYRKAVVAQAPVEMVFKMHQKLTDYATSFEQSPDFCEDMASFLHGHGVDAETRHFGWHLPSPSHGNPFSSYSPIHPVERALSQAIIAKDREDVQKFKAARAEVIRLLEPQYKRIVEAAAMLREFTYEERLCGIFNECVGCRRFHDYDEHWETQANLNEDIDHYIYTLDKIAAMFHRTMPEAIEIKVAKGVTMFDSAYSTLERGQLFVKLRWMQKQDLMEKDPRQTAKWVKKLVEDMYGQYTTIRLTRMALFEDDITDRGCEIDDIEESDDDLFELEWDLNDDMEEMDSDAEEMFERCYSQ
ncbi:hypothetical protein ACMFMG_003191 [Clarireedia jacksonii]